MSNTPRNWKDAVRLLMHHHYEPETLVPLSHLIWFVSLLSAVLLIVVGWGLGAMHILASLQDIAVSEKDIVRTVVVMNRSEITGALNAFVVRKGAYDALKTAPLLSSPR